MKLAYQGRIVEIQPIPNADRIELATVVCGEGGKWNGVVAKGAYAVGDVVTTYLQDAVVPKVESLEFLAKHGWRVKMSRFRGAPSECVIVDATSGYDVGTDLTEILGVTKYVKELPASMNGIAYGGFPSFIPKTDEPNVQTAYRFLEALRGQPWAATVKVDGSSTTAYRMGEHFGVCSRNLELCDAPSLVQWEIARGYDLPSKLPDGYAVQWETAGPGIQSNPLGLERIQAFVFDVYDIRRMKHLDFQERLQFITKLGMPSAPVDSQGTDFNLDKNELQKLAQGRYPNGKHREGIVVRPLNEMRVCGDRLSFKVINLDYKD